MDHLRNAFYISGNKELGCLVPWRPLGPAALWVALGVTTLKTWKILLAFHFLLGALLPWLIYQLAEKNLKKTAYAFGILINLFGILAFYSPIICPESVYWGLNILCLILGLNLLLKKEPRNLELIGVPLIFVVTTNFRPTAALMFYCFLIIYTLKWKTAAFTKITLLLGTFFFANLNLSLINTINGNKDWPGTLWEKNIYDRKMLRDWLKKNFEPKNLKNQNVFSIREFEALYSNLEISSEKKVDISTNENEKWIQDVKKRRKNPFLKIYDSIVYLTQETIDPSCLFFGSGVPLSGRNKYGLLFFSDSVLIRGRTHSLKILERYALNNNSFDLINATDLTSAEVGPKTLFLRHAHKGASNDFPAVWINQPFWKPGQDKKPTVFFEQFYNHSYEWDGLYEGAMWDCMVRVLGLRYSNQAYNEAAMEIIGNYPYSAFLYFDNFLNNLFVKQIGHLKERSVTLDKILSQFGDLKYPHRQNVLGSEFGNLQSSLKKEIPGTLKSNLVADWYSVTHILFWLISMCFIPITFYMLGKGGVVAWAALLNAGFYLANILPLAIYGNFGSPRYDDTLKAFVLFSICLLFYNVTIFKEKKIK